jgi:hypothetical protein
MATSKTIAGLLGPTLVATAASLLLNLGTLPALVEQASHDPALIYVSGMLMLVAGLAIVRVHNRWAADWPVLVTALGWLLLLGGLMRMLLSAQLGQLAIGVLQHTGVIYAVVLVELVIGAFLTFKAYRHERE